MAAPLKYFHGTPMKDDGSNEAPTSRPRKSPV